MYYLELVIICKEEKIKNTSVMYEESWRFYYCKHNYSVQICLTGAFDDEDITHVDGSIDPVRDLKTILKELRLKVKF